MKNYLKNTPQLRLQLIKDIVVGKGAIGTVVLDDCNFNECVNIQEFTSNKLLKIHPPSGEFTSMNYRITSEFGNPFKVKPVIFEVSQYRLEFILDIKALYPKNVTAAKV